MNAEFKTRQFEVKKACFLKDLSLLKLNWARCIKAAIPAPSVEASPKMKPKGKRKDSFFSLKSRIFSQHGFLMIEVMIALGLFSLAVTVLAQACLNAIHANEIIAQKEPAFEDFTFLYTVVLGKFDKNHLDARGDICCPQSGNANWNVQWAPTDVVDLYSGTVEATFDLPGIDKTVVYEQMACVYRPHSMTASDRQGLIDKAKSKRLAKKEAQE
jgi:hypothetical protein